jgi:hypothetical protein
MSSSVWYLSFRKKKIEFKKYPIKKSKKKDKKNPTKKTITGLFFALFILNLSLVLGAVISEDLHLNIQTTNSTGGIVTGTYGFTFNISTLSDCSNVVYSNTTIQTTDTRGIISYYLTNVSLDYDQQYWLCYYRNGTLQNNSKIVRTPYTFRARNITLSGVQPDSNFNMSGYNITADWGFFNFLGSFTNRITNLFVQNINASGNVNITGDLNVSGLIYGNGSQITGITSGTLDGYDSTFFMPLNQSVYGSFDFNGGWLGGGLTISEGDIYARTGYFYNISSLNVTNINVNGTLGASVDNQFDIGNSTHRWRDLYLSGEILSNGTGTNYFGGKLYASENFMFNDTNLSIAIGSNTGSNILGTTLLGYQAGYNNSEDLITALGAYAGYQNTGDNAVTLGYGAGQQNTGDSITVVGLQAGYQNIGNSTTLVGYLAGDTNTGNSLTAVGAYAGQQNTGTSNTIMGYAAGQQNTGSSVTAVGSQAGYNNTGDYLTSLGINAGYLNSGDDVTAIGYLAGGINQGNSTVLLGREAGYNNTGNDVVAIGYQAGKDNTVANQFILKQANINAVPLIQGDFSSGYVGIGTATPQNILNIVGDSNTTGTIYWNNVNVSAYNSTMKAYVDAVAADTNETSRFNNLTGYDCGGTDKVVGVQANGTVLCASDVTGAGGKNASGTYVYNDTTTIYFNESELNDTIDIYNNSMQVYVLGVNTSMKSYVDANSGEPTWIANWSAYNGLLLIMALSLLILLLEFITPR